ncbi:hypothetical protein K450DRAFT_222114 [Umbelopsis ramanniana AG]|uniref:Uncharacterized protein n=1 Tax=Umbelopsis ramanniana AG TaxID=1314678 RepID=A0AAD5EH70_UMBRA|nr:uncharacterized protein K450DRAFT_222114 [Umbelopsis ramanniana AG]KAI8583643.1 hypothetical protein K450DRAFT_222114 [Umbelopsis ramanniana AG]
MHAIQDSHFTHIHWRTSQLAVLSDDWIGERLPEESVDVPKDHQLVPDEDGDIFLGTLTFSSKKKPKKPTWDHSTMEEDTAMAER